MRVVTVLKWSAYLLVVALCTEALMAQAPAQKTATEFYMEYRAAFDKAKKVEDVLPFMAADMKKQIESTPAGERPKMFEFIKMMNPSSVKVVKEDRTASGATLTVEGVDMDKKKTYGKIDVIREGGAWKLGKETWGNTPSS